MLVCDDDDDGENRTGREKEEKKKKKRKKMRPSFVSLHKRDEMRESEHIASQLDRISSV